MRSVVVYESQTGCTHLVAEAIGKGLHELGEVHVVPVHHADAELANGADLVVVGGPTHIHGLSRPSTRKAAIEATEKPGAGIEPDPDAEGDGLREWFDALGDLEADAAAFDTRMEGPPAFTGRASKGIAKRLRHHGLELVVPPESFLVTKTTHLEDGEIEHARTWGATIASKVAARAI
ncbi:MAG: flavodoxin family protein [Acidimicrobiales bacterium]|nr:flavodoxin family protein [Acidimicrobiales bacterium]